ncbi:hypothetical protein J2X31_003615 [Flavobacterium arsenatis]|uniref:Histidine kinase n=1 Tax=Flavobacterium arsenatis TaxID=1484332 RepID=A0ABU1TUN9_9FLAO|nr:hypothetical protein [Flavobacterium arsenatis]MDR6969582.1 hypothetical protein [Flavobacterium arsenatis]
MKKLLSLIAILPFMTFCNGQNTSKLNEFVNSTDLKGKIWHTGVNGNDGYIGKEKQPIINVFSDDIFLYFLDKDSVQLKYTVYSPSIGGRTSIINGTYQVDNKNEVSIIFTEPKNTFGGHTITINDKDVQYSLYAISRVKKNEVSQPDITELPQINTYHFKIIEQLADNNFVAELTLLDDRQAKYKFGIYKFENIIEPKSQH